METGERGFLLTGHTQLLAPYDSGQTEVTGARAQLNRDLADDSTAIRLLAAVTDAGTTWQQRSAEPEIAETLNGTMTDTSLGGSVVAGKRLFDALRERLAALQDRINEVTATAVRTANGIQNEATLVSIACAALALLVGAATIVLVRRSLLNPINRLLRQVRHVSAGHLDQPVDATGPSEVAEIAHTVEAMRERIRTDIDKAEIAAGNVARSEEADRIAGDLGNRVSKQLFATSLAVQSAANRYPKSRAVLGDITRSLDNALSELRLAMYGQPAASSHTTFVARLTDQISELASTLPTEPELRLRGDLDRDVPDRVTAELIAVVRDTLVTVVRPETANPPKIDVSSEDAIVRLRITIDQPTADHIDALEAIANRANRLGGNLTINDITTDEATRFTLDWQMPLVSRPPEQLGPGS
jgi:nitrate/nitrite-specific signal transduction histidine kinase